MGIKRGFFSVLLVLMICFGMLSPTAFAYAEDSTQETEAAFAETISQEEENAATPIETVPLSSAGVEEGMGFSEKGNVATRDLLFDKNTNKQFITIQTRNGKTFYIIIDYDKPIDEEGNQYETYFLNLVDEADIQALLDEAGVVASCSCVEKCSAGAVNSSCVICNKNMTECAGEEKPAETEPAEPTEPSELVEEPEAPHKISLIPVILIVVILGGALFFYLKINKPNSKTKGNTDLNDYDYGVDDEEYAEFEPYEEGEKK